MKVKALALLIVSTFALCPVPEAHAEEGSLSSVEFGIGRISDVQYIPGGSEAQRLDIYLPKWQEGLRPIVIYIHGGSWAAGDKTEHPEMILPLIEGGYIVFSINYRLTDTATYPAQIHDCKSAVRWVRKNARKYGGDPQKIAVMGDSAGAHLAALLGTSAGIRELEMADSDVSCRVQAVVDWYGPADLTLVEMAEGADITPVVNLLGGSPAENIELARLASATTFISPDDPPFLIIHGVDDPVVPIELSQYFASLLSKGGILVELIAVEGGEHGHFVDTEPSHGELMEEVLTFLDTALNTE